MANVAFRKGLLANLPATFAEGTFYVTTDERALYLDVNDSSRIRLGDFQEFETIDALKANVNPSTAALYYVTSLNVLAKWNGSEYVQINLDSGMTSVEVVGAGNAVTAATYNPSTRKLTLTMGESFATQDFVGAIPEGYEETTIVDYINKKASETLKAASGNSSETAASVKQALDEHIEDVTPRLEALEAVDHEHANKELLDTYTQTEADLADAVAKKHEHANKAELDLIVSGDKAKWDKAVSDLAEEVARAKLAEETNAAAAKAADDKAVAAQNDVDALEGLVGEVEEGKTVVQMIADAKTAATYDDTKVKEDIAANAEAIELLNDGAEVEGSVDYKIAQAVAAIMLNPDETMNSINELVTWINGHAEDALELSNLATQNKEDIEALEGLVGTTGVAEQIAAAIEAALKIEGVDKYALAADLTAAIARVAAMEAKVANWDAAEQNAKDYATGLNNAMNTRVEALEAIDHEHANADVLNGITAEKVAAWDGAQAAAEATAAGALAAAKTELEGKITAENERAVKAEQDLDARIDTLEAIQHDAYVAADEQVLADAKAYADEQIAAKALAWGSF